MFNNSYREHPTAAAPVRAALVGALLLLSYANSFAAVSPITGGKGGATFTDLLAAKQQLTAINLRSGSWIDSIQGITNTGNLPAHGGTGGTLKNITWPANEYLVRAYGRYGFINPYIGQITFVTNTGRVLGPYGAPNNFFTSIMLPMQFDFTAPTGNVIAGFTGRSGQFLDAVGFVYGPNATTPTPTPTNNLVVNGSFETLPGAGNYFNSILGWTGVKDTIEINTPAIYGARGATGSKVVELDANIAGIGSGLYQTVTTGLNKNFTLSVDLAARANTAVTTNTVEIWWSNTLIATVDPATTTFKTYTYNVVGTGATDRLEFREQAGDDNSLGGIIDNVQLVVNNTPPPPPPPAVNTPDLAVSVAQPVPGFVVNAMSEIPVTVTNQGTLGTTTPLSLTMVLPPNANSPLKFATNADNWVCINPANTLACTYKIPLAAGASTTVRLQVRAGANTLNQPLGPFIAKVAPVTGETNTVNNTSAAMTSQTAVAALALPGLTDPLDPTKSLDPFYSKILLDPAFIPKYAMPLPNLAAAHYVLTPNTTKIAGTDSYNLDIKQIQAQILPPGFPGTNVYAYGDPQRPETYSFPAHTIAAHSTLTGLNTNGIGKPVKVQFSDSRTIATHLLPIDRSIHGAMGVKNAAGVVTKVEPDIRSVAHFHGVTKAPQNSDGYPEAWKSPITGETGANFSATSPTVPFNPNAFDQPNNQEGTLLWYHDHTLGMTRLNVYAGLAGAYVLRDSNEMSMINANKLPNGAYEVPLVLQDRNFFTDGSLAYPDLNPDVPGSPTPSMVPEFYGNVMLVNGVSWPFLNVEPRRYRFRMLNGSDSRFYKLALTDSTGAPSTASIQVIGTEGGFLNAPTPVSTVTIGPGERYDLIIDFASANGKTITLTNSAASPFPNGAPITAGIDDQVMQFRVVQPLTTTVPNNPLPTTLRAAAVPTLTPTVATPRQVLLAESVDNNGRILPILGTVQGGILGWMDTLTEKPLANSIETWEIFNDTVDAHPIHLHGGHFQVIDRQAFTATAGTNNMLSGITFPTAATTANPEEKTWKDTVITYPGQVTRIRVKFENAGLFVWHCHILEHEDHDMMRPLQVQ